MEPIILSIPGEKSPEKAKEEALLASCRYYKGETECPFVAKDGDNRPSFWYWEKGWFFDALRGSDFSEQLSEFRRYGVRDLLSGVNMDETLLAELFHRWSKWAYSVKDALPNFASMILKTYGAPAGL